MGQEGTDKVWDTWKTCRNEVFHYFPESPYHIDIQSAGDRIKMVLEVCEEIASFLPGPHRA
ncbi:MAG: hypothetical protein UZ21_OP11001000908 [Microgenomates bacterium OLB22]|nr:MAG: hypothetical protein UZ21_OP11001000908 [Microgenomates bacterium OLB22]